MNLKEMLEKARKRSALQNELVEVQDKVYELADRLNFDSRRRSENLRLLRCYLGVTQEQFVEALILRSQGSLSKMERGESEVEDAKARMIELELGLAVGWLDRNNGETLFLRNDEVELIKNLRKYNLNVTEAVNHLFANLDKTDV